MAVRTTTCSYNYR